MTSIKFGSVCSGIEAASVAWHPFGWKAAWFSEIESFPSAVLKHHYPDVPNLGDMTTLPDRIRSGEVEAPDVFCGGTPCQAFSVAGLRKSLGDARGNLSLTFCEIANAIDDARLVRGEQPSIVFWENVPGVLSTKDNAFGCFLAQLCGGSEPLHAPGGWTNAGCVSGPKRTAAWRVLDAQYFGVAQRRRRVFVVASARDDFDPAAVLFEFDGVRRDIAPSRQARKTVAGGVEIGPGGGRFTDLNPTLDTRAKDDPIRNQLAGAVITMAHGQGGAEIGFDRGPTLTCNHEAPITAYAIQAGALRTNPESGPDGVGIQADQAYTLEARAEVQCVAAIAQFGDTADTLTARYGSSPCADRGMNVAAQPIAFPAKLSATQHASTENLAPALGATNPTAVAFNMHKSGNEASSLGISVDKTDCLRAFEKSPFAVLPSSTMQVRRLTPVECERLQGFPDNYTAIPWRKKPASECPDGPRYKALGNSWAVPVVRWIGQRINFFVGQNKK